MKNKIRGFEYVEDRFAKEVVDGKVVLTGKVDKSISLPVRGTSGSAGYDFFCPCKVVVPPHSRSPLIFTNVKAYMFDNKEYLYIVPRSSLGVKKGMLMSASGVIDFDYYSNEDTGGNIAFCFYNSGNESIIIEKGERFCQGIFMQFLKADKDVFLNEFRVGGYGSTGR